MGYGSITLWTPDREFGIAVLTNQAYRARAVINIIALRAFEEHFGIEHVDWEARYAHFNFSHLTCPMSFLNSSVNAPLNSR